MITGNHYYKEEELISFVQLKENHPEQISNALELNEFTSLEEMLQSGCEGFLRSLPGKSTNSNSCTLQHNFGTIPPPQTWLVYVNPYPELKLIMLRNALVIPSDDLVFNGKRSFISEVRDSSDRLVRESMARMSELTITADKVSSLRNEAVPVDGTYLYCGKFWSHYGHFTTETLSSLWPYFIHNLDPKEIKPLYSALNNGTGIKLPYIGTALHRIGIDPQEVVFAKKPLIIERLILPVPSARIHNLGQNYLHPAQDKAWSAISSNSQGPANKKIYLSRKLFKDKDKDKRPLSNEEEIERLFKSQGFEIIYPEQLSFPEQIEIMRGSKVIAGPAGSNLLNAVYANAGTDIIVISPLSFNSRIMIMLADIKRFNAYFFFSRDENIRHDSEEPWSVDPEGLNNFLIGHGIFKKRNFFQRLISTR
jgi:capsular polysaccharide biosynthesis protein